MNRTARTRTVGGATRIAAALVGICGVAVLLVVQAASRCDVGAAGGGPEPADGLRLGAQPERGLGDRGLQGAGADRERAQPQAEQSEPERVRDRHLVPVQPRNEPRRPEVDGHRHQGSHLGGLDPAANPDVAACDQGLEGLRFRLRRPGRARALLHPGAPRWDHRLRHGRDQRHDRDGGRGLHLDVRGDARLAREARRKI